MPEFTVLWSMRGRKTVEAKDEDEARQKFYEGLENPDVTEAEGESDGYEIDDILEPEELAAEPLFPNAEVLKAEDPYDQLRICEHCHKATPKVRVPCMVCGYGPDGKPAFAFTAVVEQHGIVIGRADKGTKGYTLCPKEGTYSTYEKAQARADEMNAEYGIDKQEAIKTVLGTM